MNDDIKPQFQAELRQLERYLHEALGIAASIRPWRGAERLPHFLREQYGFAETTLLGTFCLLAVDTGGAEQSPAVVRKHIDLLRTKQDGEVIYVRPSVTAYNRKRLVEHKVPFVVPGNQMYLPMLAIDLREYFRRQRAELPTFSPATQVVVLLALLRGGEDELIPSVVAGRLGYSAMTMTRAFDELEAANLGTVIIRGRERCLRLTRDRQELWAKAQPFLRSPVLKRLFIRRIDPNKSEIRAGLTALARYSMLAPPAHATYAFSRDEWKRWCQRHKVIDVPAQDPDVQEIEIWNYSPVLFEKEGFVDPLSLYLSLKGDNDERLQSALDEMMREQGW